MSQPLPVSYLFNRGSSDLELCSTSLFLEVFRCVCKSKLYIFFVQQENFVHSIGGKLAGPAAEGEKSEGFIGVWADEYAKRTGVFPVNNRQQGTLSKIWLLRFSVFTI